MLEHWLWLAQRPGISQRRKFQLLRFFGSAENLYFADAGRFRMIPELTQRDLDALMDKSLAEYRDLAEACARRGTRILCYDDPAYPVRLRLIQDPPLVLYCRGKLPDLDNLPVIGVVGTRKPSAYGSSNARRLGAELGQCDVVVVSGLAEGVDTEAMTGALTAGSPAVGVSGCGVDVVYPAWNRGLYDRVEQCGCILSEYAPGTPPKRWNFPRRNRIISGLSLGVLVVEAPEKSGALITARLAKAQGRDIYALPHNAGNPGYSGTQQLLQEGAVPIEKGWDVICAYQEQFRDKIPRDTDGVSACAYGERIPAANRDLDSSRKPERKKDIDNGTVAPYSDGKTVPQELSIQEQAVVDCLGAGERRMDDVIAQCGLAPNLALQILTGLELKRIVMRRPGRLLCLRKS